MTKVHYIKEQMRIWLEMQADLRREKDIEEATKIKSNLYHELMTIRNQIDVILDVLKRSEEK